MGKIGGAPLDRGSPTDKARCGVGMPEGWLVGVPAPRDPMGSGTPRATLGTGTGSGPWRKGTGKAQPLKQQNEPRKQTKTQSHKRGNKQKPANPRLEETKANK